MTLNLLEGNAPLVKPADAYTSTILVYPPVSTTAPAMAALRYARIYDNDGDHEFIGLLPYEVIGYVRKPDEKNKQVKFQLAFTNYGQAAVNRPTIHALVWSGRVYNTPMPGYAVSAGDLEGDRLEIRNVAPQRTDVWPEPVPPYWLQQAVTPTVPDTPGPVNGRSPTSTNQLYVQIDEMPEPAPPDTDSNARDLMSLLVGAYIWIGQGPDDTAPRCAMVLLDPEVRTTTNSR